MCNQIHEYGYDLTEQTLESCLTNLNFEIINENILELASSLLLFRNFIKKTITEHGEDGYFDSQFTKKDVTDLENEFKKLNPNYQNESSFWYNEINSLRAQIK